MPGIAVRDGPSCEARHGRIAAAMPCDPSALSVDVLAMARVEQLTLEGALRVAVRTGVAEFAPSHGLCRRSSARERA